MARYIDLDDDEIVYCGNDGEYERYNIPTDIRTADVVERKSGEWIVIHDEPFADRYKCSSCGEYANVDLYGEFILSDFCPNCGADMRGE